MITVKEFFNRGKKGPNHQPMAVRCDTLDQAKRLMVMFRQEGAVWQDGEQYSPTDTYWNERFNCYSNNGGRCPEEWYHGNGFKVISFNEIITTDTAHFMLYNPSTHEWC